MSETKGRNLKLFRSAKRGKSFHKMPFASYFLIGLHICNFTFGWEMILYLNYIYFLVHIKYNKILKNIKYHVI